MEYLLAGLECTGTPYTAGRPFSLALEMLCDVSTDINGGGIGLILSFNEYLKTFIQSICLAGQILFEYNFKEISKYLNHLYETIFDIHVTKN